MGLVALPVALSGAWSQAGRRRWEGEARASEPIVATVFAAQRGQVFWAKSDAGLLLPVALELWPTSHDGCQFQLLFQLGSSLLMRPIGGRVPNSAWLPPIPARHAARTGRPLPFALLESDPPVQVELLFLVRRDVKVRRNRVWGVRPFLLPELPAVLRGAMARGRHGVFSEAEIRTPQA